MALRPFGIGPHPEWERLSVSFINPDPVEYDLQANPIMIPQQRTAEPTFQFVVTEDLICIPSNPDIFEDVTRLEISATIKPTATSLAMNLVYVEVIKNDVILASSVDNGYAVTEWASFCARIDGVSVGDIIEVRVWSSNGEGTNPLVWWAIRPCVIETKFKSAPEGDSMVWLISNASFQLNDVWTPSTVLEGPNMSYTRYELRVITNGVPVSHATFHPIFYVTSLGITHSAIEGTQIQQIDVTYPWVSIGHSLSSIELDRYPIKFPIP